MAEKTRVSTKRAGKIAGAGEEAGGATLPVLRPSQCRAYLRRELAREFRGIVQGFVAGAKKGSCQHVRLAKELVAPPERRARRGKSVVQELIEEFESRKG